MDKEGSTKFQMPNFKQIPMDKIQNLKQSFRNHSALTPPSLLTGEGWGEGERKRILFDRFGRWKLNFGYYLGFGNWKLGFSLIGFLCLILVVSLGAGCQKSKAGIIVAGSTSVEPFAELLAEEYMLHHSGSHIYVQGGGSSAGIEAVRSRAAHIGMSSRSLMPTEKDLHPITVARDAIAVIVHPENKVHDLTLTQIRKIFSGGIVNWNELGGAPKPIILVTREEGSGTREAFQKLVMGKEEISLGALVQDSNGAIRQVVSNDPNAIGYISLGLVNEQVKALRLSDVEPTVANIENGSYTLVRPFLFVFNDKPAGEAQAFVDFVLSPEAQKLLAREGLVPILATRPGG
jgi:phosphate transport system substrate-binding protein